MGAKEKEDRFKGDYSFFLFPVKITDNKAFYDFLKNSGCWQEKFVCFEDINYMMNYAQQINSPTDGRMKSFAFTNPSELKIPKFEDKIDSKLSELKETLKICTPYKNNDTVTLKEVSLFVFDTDIAFIEFYIRYNTMTVDQIIEFIYLFRSLRNKNTDENSYLGFREDEKDVETVIADILPAEKAKYELCFSNQSEIKRQAIVITAIDSRFAGFNKEKITPEEIDKCRFWLSHGYSHSFEYLSLQGSSELPYLSNFEFLNQYELLYNVASDTYWGGSQDSIACIINNAHGFQHTHIHNDYLFMILLLLHQRFVSIDLINQLSVAESTDADIQEIYDKTIRLKTCYSFRVISDDRIFQNVYSRMYNIFELDPMIKDLEEANDKLIQLQNKKEESEKEEQRKRDEEESEAQKKSTEKLDRLMLVISILTISSTLIDLSSYLESFSTFEKYAKWISLGVNVIVIVLAAYIIYIKPCVKKHIDKKRRKS